jgi:hypothetical protein
MMLSIIAGLAIWPVFLTMLGVEPWDNQYGIVVMLGLGLAFGLLAPKKPWLGPLGLYVGQCIYGAGSFLAGVFFHTGTGVNFFFPLGMFVLLLFSAPALITSFLGSRIHRAYQKSKAA